MIQPSRVRRTSPTARATISERRIAPAHPSTNAAVSRRSLSLVRHVVADARAVCTIARKSTKSNGSSGWRGRRPDAAPRRRIADNVPATTGLSHSGVSSGVDCCWGAWALWTNLIAAAAPSIADIEYAAFPRASTVFSSARR